MISNPTIRFGQQSPRGMKFRKLGAALALGVTALGLAGCSNAGDKLEKQCETSTVADCLTSARENLHNPEEGSARAWSLRKLLNAPEISLHEKLKLATQGFYDGATSTAALEGVKMLKDNSELPAEARDRMNTIVQYQPYTDSYITTGIIGYTSMSCGENCTMQVPMYGPVTEYYTVTPEQYKPAINTLNEWVKANL